MKSTLYNNRRGILKGPDMDAAGRFAVQLSGDPNDQKSFKKENLTFMGCPTQADASLRALRIQGQLPAFFAGLFDRIREIDILKHDTWSSVDDICGTCTLVTCMNLLSCLGYRDSTAWHDTLELGSRLLQVDGYIAQFDMVGYAGFGESSAMEAHVKEKRLPLELVENMVSPAPGFACVLWRNII